MKAIKTPLAAFIAVAAAGLCASNLHASVSDPTLPGNHQADLWLPLNVTNYPGYGSFPGTAPWSAPVTASNGATIKKISGGAYMASDSLYFGGFSPDANTSGATLSVQDPSTIANLNTVIFQIEIGEALGYDFFNHALPVLNYNGGSQALANTAFLVDQLQTGTFDAPGLGEQPLYTNTYTLLWDLSDISDPITSIAINFTGVQHARVYNIRLDQTDAVIGTLPIPEPTTLATASVGAGLFFLRKRKA